jgi:hypothetical protein
MRRSVPLLLLLGLSPCIVGAQPGIHSFAADFSASGLVPVSWASDSPTLSHLGFDANIGLEYDSPISVLLRLEAGYIGISASRIAPTGELYRAWEGARFALLTGYLSDPVEVGKLGRLAVSLLGGGALTAADYTDTALAYAYPSIVLEPRLALVLKGAGASAPVQGPWLAVPVELMFRAGTYTLSPGLSLGWSYRLGAIR